VTSCLSDVSYRRVGIVIPAFNATAWIETCLRSLLAQTHRRWIAVVVDDGSSDDTGAIAARLAEPRIAPIAQAHAGVSAARNRGIGALPDCDSVLFLDADDWLAPDALERLLEQLETFPSAVAAAGACGFVPEHAQPGVRARRVKRPPAGELLTLLLERNLFANGGHLLIRRAAIERAGLFRLDLDFGEDWEYWIRLAVLGPIAAAPGRPVLFVRERAGGAYLRQVVDPLAFEPCVEAIFENPMLADRLGERGALRMHMRALAETLWITGCELRRLGRAKSGLSAMRRSVAKKPSLKRVGLLAAAHVQPLLRTARWPA
jgi:glycosyltransferase involved in cell wall biosynthesis